jgi:VIT1/CCC1 family predicted Fe2+/Mn2+ transporter
MSQQKPSPTTHNQATLERYADNLKEEVEGIHLYRMLAAHERNAQRKQVLLDLASTEERHAEIWRKRLRLAGIETPDSGPSLRVKMLGFLARRFGVRSVLPVVRMMEAGVYSKYMSQGSVAASLAPEELEHGRTLARLEKGGSDRTADITTYETWHRRGAGGALRASIFGVSDGLVSNASLVMGFAGAQVDIEFIVLAGIAGLLAGSFSMAVGEYVSMRAQRELFERQIALERTELEIAPEEERNELLRIYKAKGLPQEEAETVVDRLMEDPEVALDTLIREELGLDPDELGSPWAAAIGSFISFALGALVPVAPFFFGSVAGITPLIILSIVLSALALFGVGASLSLLTGRNFIVSGGRQVALGAIAAALTFGIGRLIGVSAGL